MRHFGYRMQSGRWVDNHVPRRQFYRLFSRRIMDQELTPLILIRAAEEERTGDICPDTLPPTGRYRPQRIVHMRTKAHANVVPVEKRRDDTQWQYGTVKKRVRSELSQNER
ncbi:hypothetical protein AA103581_1628 [Gluconobacter wancherniae NBRC 103581]|nr:hypothetical protein AA103581_1628 [Gluconobacter wancherniae NBRC 103581]